MRFVVYVNADLERVFENVYRDVVAVVAVVIVAAAVWISSIENDFKITISSCIKLSLAGPPIQGLLIMRPRASPICLIATKPKVIS